MGGALPDVPQSHLACVCGLLLGAGAPAERARIGVKPAAWSIYLCFKEAVLYFSLLSDSVIRVRC